MNVLSILLSAPVLVGAVVLLCLANVYYRYVHKPLQVFKEVGIAGPKPKPIIGNLDLFGQFKGDGRAFGNYLRTTYGPVSGVFLGPTPVYFIADMDLIKEITVKHFDKFVDRMNQRSILRPTVDGKDYDNLFFASGAEWKRRWNVLSPAFSAHKMKLMEPLIKESTSRLADKISAAAENGETVEALQLYNKMSMEVILSTAFGRSLDVQGGSGGKIFEAAVTVFNALAPPKEGDPVNVFRMLQFLLMSFPFLDPLVRRIVHFMKIKKSVDFLHKSAAKIIDKRMKESDGISPRKDLLQLMLDARDSETQKGLEKGEIIADSVVFILTGYETTSTTLAFTTYLLAANPEVQERLANEINEYFEENPGKSMYDASHELQYLDMVIEETLRMYSATPALVRLCNEDCVLNGVQFRKGALAFLLVDNIHHDPNVWTDPEEFNPERFAPEEKAKHHSCAHMPFGYGPRSCIGMKLALLEAKMALIETVGKFKVVLAPETKVPLEVRAAATLKPKHGVFVKYESRKAA